MSSGRRFLSLHLHEMIRTRIFNAAWKRSRNIMENKCLCSFPGFSFSHYLRTSLRSRRMTGAFHLVYFDIYRCHKSEFTLIGRPSVGFFQIADEHTQNMNIQRIERWIQFIRKLKWCCFICRPWVLTSIVYCESLLCKLSSRKVPFVLNSKITFREHNCLTSLWKFLQRKHQPSFPQ